MPKRKAPIEQPALAALWSPPSTLKIESPGKPLGCVATTYTFHAAFFEAELLPRFLGLKFDQTEGERPFIVEREVALGTCVAAALVDAAHVDGAQTTLRWDQLAVRVPGGVQHAKVSLLVWERCVRILVASANLTRQGYRRNREIASVLDFYDHPDAAPRRLALDILDFLGELVDSGWTAGPPRALARTRDLLARTGAQLQGWRQMPEDFSSGERMARAVFAAGMPGRDGRSPRSPLEQLLQQWGTRRASRIAVMTPFVAPEATDAARVLDLLRRVQPRRDVEVQLVVPGRPSQTGEGWTVSVPRTFRDAWAQAWRKPEPLGVYVVPPHRPREPPLARDLHAKAILLVGDATALLMCGSSNFTSHGMGVGAYNVEANLCFLDAPEDKRGGLLFADRLPVDWQGDYSEDVAWPEKAAPLDEDVPGDAPTVPRVFAWAAWNQNDVRLTMALDPVAPLPPEWSIRVAGAHAEQTPSIFTHRDVAAEPRPERLQHELDAGFRTACITALQVTWLTQEGTEAEGHLLVQVESGEHLLPPEEFRALGADAIIQCLLSGKSPAEWVEAQESTASGRASSKLAALDPLRTNDPEGYTLYRTRRLGRALATLGERLLGTVRTRDAFAYRLRQDPLGPLSLADALIRDWGERPGAQAEQENAALLFALAEVCLSLAHVGSRVEPELWPLFTGTIDEIVRRLLPLRERAGVGTNLRAYVNAVTGECGRLLAAPPEVRHAY